MLLEIGCENLKKHTVLIADWSFMLGTKLRCLFMQRVVLCE